MWQVYLIVTVVLSVFIILDIKLTSIWEAFSARGYDLCAQVAGKNDAIPLNGNLRHDEYRNKIKIMENH